MKPKGKIFLLDDDELIVSMLARALRGDGYEVRAETATEGAMDKVRSFSPDVALLDINMPGQSGIDLLGEIVKEGIPAKVVMLTSDDTAETAVRAMKSGAADYLTKPFNLDEVKIVIDRIVESGNLLHEVEYLRKITSGVANREIIGKSNAIHKLKVRCEKLAEARVPAVLVTGESGTGKEVFSRYLHRLIHRNDPAGFAPFVGVNCAALPEPLVESELFGHEKGAFTDAKSEKKGIFEQGQCGSVLLDEIGEMRKDLQAKLLRVLEERTVRRVGGRQDIPVDTLVFATTNRNLEEAVEKGEFRVDLYFRLNAFSLHVPPLRERSEDIPLLAGHFLREYSERYGKPGFKGFAPEAMEMLVSHRWPGNVRELRNVVERIVVLEQEEVVTPEQLPAEIQRPRAKVDERATEGLTIPDTGLSLEDVERHLIAQALGKAGGNKTVAAKLLGISYDSLRYQAKKFGLE